MLTIIIRKYYKWQKWGNKPSNSDNLESEGKNQTVGVMTVKTFISLFYFLSYI